MSDSLMHPTGVKRSVLAVAGFCFLLAGSLAFAVAIKMFGMIAGFLVLIALVGLPVVYGIVAFPRFGIVVLLIMAYLIMWFLNMGVNFPLGTVMDAIQALLILSFAIQQRNNPNWAIFKTPVTTLILVWIGYNLLAFFNPTAESRLAWVYTIRSVAVVMLTYFIFTYYITSVKFIRLIIRIWLALALFGAIYAFKQEYFGFFPFEQRTLDADPLLQNLLFINGHWRKFSIFAEPVTFAYVMATSAILCICLIWGPTNRFQKIILSILAGFYLMTMLYSGTRGAYVLVPAALAMFAVLCFNRKVMLFSIAGAFLIAVMIYIPTSNPNITRFQSAFRPSNDASFNVRKANQKMIQPYILKHPLGGGLGATGMWGVRFSPGSFLANFPPDSGYVRVAVELGWIGLIILCTLLFVVLKTGINNFFIIKDPELKAYCLAMVLIIFALCIGNYPQEALVQFPTNIYFYLYIALINVTLILDKQKQEQKAAMP